MRPKQAVNMAAVPKQTNTVLKLKKVVPNSTELLGRKKVPKLVGTSQTGGGTRQSLSLWNPFPYKWFYHAMTVVSVVAFIHKEKGVTQFFF
jgi:hypothetical protein